MTNKIIIDGVDVSGCEYYKDNECRCTCECFHLENGAPVTEYDFASRTLLAEYNYCFKNPNCYYKQLKRITQECEELHKKMAEVIFRATGGMLSYSTYTLDAIEDAFNNMVSIQVDKETKELEEKNNLLTDQVNRYKQALENIKRRMSVGTSDYCWSDVMDIIDEVKK